MFGRVRVGIALTAMLVVVPGVALGGGWPWPVDGRVALGYAATWTDAAGRACSHGGIDIVAPAGARVSACASGRVAFAGRVPAAGGGTVLAVSLVTPDGLRVTYLPLAALGVSSGREVDAGEAIGELAAAGDGSTAAAHLHLSVHRGEAPIDPATLLGVETVPGGSVAPAEPVPAPAPASGPASVVPLQRPPSGAGRAAAQPAPEGVPVASHAPAVSPVRFADSVQPGVRVLAPAELGPRLTVRIRTLPDEVRLDLRAVVMQAQEAAAAGRGIAVRLLLAALAGLLLVAALRAAARSVADAPRVEPLLAPARGERR